MSAPGFWTGVILLGLAGNCGVLAADIPTHEELCPLGCGFCRDCPAQPESDNKPEAPKRNKPCDQALADRYMQNYERKKQKGLELMRHSSELNLDAQREVLEFLDIEAKRYGWEAASDRALDKGWDTLSPAAKFAPGAVTVVHEKRTFALGCETRGVGAQCGRRNGQGL